MILISGCCLQVLELVGFEAQHLFVWLRIHSTWKVFVFDYRVMAELCGTVLGLRHCCYCLTAIKHYSLNRSCLYQSCKSGPPYVNLLKLSVNSFVSCQVFQPAVILLPPVNSLFHWSSIFSNFSLQQVFDNFLFINSRSFSCSPPSFVKIVFCLGRCRLFAVSFCNSRSLLLGFSSQKAVSLRWPWLSSCPWSFAESGTCYV